MGMEYCGTRNVTQSGRTCQAWTSDYPHNVPTFENTMFPHDANVEAAENFCRNPDRSSDGPWCYTMDVDVRWEYCDIRQCELECPPSSPTITEAGAYFTPGYREDGSGAYPGGLDCRWTFQAPVGQQIELQVTSMSIEENGNCSKDHLELRDQDQLLGTLCGRRTIKNHIAFHSRNNELQAHFTTDLDGNYNGIKLFVIFFTTPDPSPILACSRSGYNITLPGTYTSPGYEEDGTGHYPHNMDCKWNFVAPIGMMIELQVINMTVEESAFCSKDSFYVLGSMCGLRQMTKPSTFYSDGNYLNAHFRSDFEGNHNGVKLQIHFFTHPPISSNLACSRSGYNITSPGTYTSPGYEEDGSGSYPYGMCVWTFIAPVGMLMELQVISMDIGDCCFFWLFYDHCYDHFGFILFDGITADDSSPRLGRLCGNKHFDNPIVFHSSNNAITALLRPSYSHVQYNGFKLKLTFFTTPNPSPILACSRSGYNITAPGNYTSPGYEVDQSGQFPYDMTCLWRFVAQGSMNGTLTMISLDTRMGLDSLSFYQNNSWMDYEGNTTLIGNQIELRFLTDNYYYDPGFMNRTFNGFKLVFEYASQESTEMTTETLTTVAHTVKPFTLSSHLSTLFEQFSIITDKRSSVFYSKTNESLTTTENQWTSGVTTLVPEKDKKMCTSNTSGDCFDLKRAASFNITRLVGEKETLVNNKTTKISSTPRLPADVPLFQQVFKDPDVSEKRASYKRPVEATAAVGMGTVAIAGVVSLLVIVCLCDAPVYRKELKKAKNNVLGNKKSKLAKAEFLRKRHSKKHCSTNSEIDYGCNKEEKEFKECKTEHDGIEEI